MRLAVTLHGSVGGVISDSFTSPRLFREQDTQGAATFILVCCFLYVALKRMLLSQLSLSQPNSIHQLILIKVTATTHSHYIDMFERKLWYFCSRRAAFGSL